MHPILWHLRSGPTVLLAVSVAGCVTLTYGATLVGGLPLWHAVSAAARQSLAFTIPITIAVTSWAAASRRDRGATSALERTSARPGANELSFVVAYGIGAVAGGLAGVTATATHMLTLGPTWGGLAWSYVALMVAGLLLAVSVGALLGSWGNAHLMAPLAAIFISLAMWGLLLTVTYDATTREVSVVHRFGPLEDTPWALWLGEPGRLAAWQAGWLAALALVATSAGLARAYPEGRRRRLTGFVGIAGATGAVVAAMGIASVPRVGHPGEPTRPIEPVCYPSDDGPILCLHPALTVALPQLARIPAMAASARPETCPPLDVVYLTFFKNSLQVEDPDSLVFDPPVVNGDLTVAAPVVSEHLPRAGPGGPQYAEIACFGSAW